MYRRATEIIEQEIVPAETGGATIGQLAERLRQLAARGD